jgi:hypothetical protein
MAIRWYGSGRPLAYVEARNEKIHNPNALGHFAESDEAVLFPQEKGPIVAGRPLERENLTAANVPH